jgi:hypothetical protein
VSAQPGLFDKLAGAQGVKMLCGMTVIIGPARPEMRRRVAAFVSPAGARAGRVSDYVLMALHYFGHVLGRYSKDDSRTYELAGELRQAVYHIIEEGVWPGSNLLEYARLAEPVEFTASARDGLAIPVALIRPLLGDDLDLAFDLPAGASDKELILSVVVLFQGVMAVLDKGSIELFDKSLRYLQSFHEEGADWTVPGAARNLANRAFREAGGDAG